jgi:primosomal protein N''
MITQAISTQLSLHNIKASNASKQPLNAPLNDGDGEEVYEDDFERTAGNRSVRSDVTTNTMREEEAKLKVEQQEVKRQMFINVQPYVAQTLNLANNPGGYSNPFALMSGGNKVNLKTGGGA